MSIIKLEKSNGRKKLYIFGKKIMSIGGTKYRYERIIKKLSMQDCIWQINDIEFYVPNYPLDLIQSHIVDNNKFFEEEILKALDEYIPENASILDIGANIGNHSLYWACVRNAKKIHSFEPRKQTFNILSKNIEINNLEDIIVPHKMALSNESTTASIQKFNLNNTGGAVIQKNPRGKMIVEKLDNISLEMERIDFIKMDVEGHELLALKGMKDTLSKYKPLLFIEIFDTNFEEVDSFLSSLQYSKIKAFGDNYLYGCPQ